jgi:hypothetical protein
MKRLLNSIIIIIVIVSCTKGGMEIKNAVIAYNRQLIEALSTANAGRLQYFATPEEIGRVDAYILYLKKDKKLLISDIKELRFLKIERTDNEAKVWTEERWVYYYIDFKTRQRLTEDETVHYKNLYTLIYKEGHWMVDKIDIKEQG